MTKYIIKRLLASVLVLLGVVTMVFFVSRVLPSNPATKWAGTRATQEQLAAAAEELGLKRCDFMARIKMKRPAEAITLESAFKEFVVAQSAKGVAEKTLKTYHSHFNAAGKHIDTGKTFAELQKYDLDQMVVSMREAGLAHNSISSYVRVMKTFLTWCNHEGYTFLNIPTYKQKETVNSLNIWITTTTAISRQAKGLAACASQTTSPFGCLNNFC